MLDSSWDASLSRLIELQEVAAEAVGSESAEFEIGLVETEQCLLRDCHDLRVKTRAEARLGLRMAHDILTVEALAPLRRQALPDLISKVIAWTDCDPCGGRL